MGIGRLEIHGSAQGGNGRIEIGVAEIGGFIRGRGCAPRIGHPDVKVGLGEFRGQSRALPPVLDGVVVLADPRVHLSQAKVGAHAGRVLSQGGLVERHSAGVFGLLGQDRGQIAVHLKIGSTFPYGCL